MSDLLDAYALIALALDEPAAAEVEALIRGGQTSVTPTNLAEAVDVCVRVRSVPYAAVRATFEPLLETPIAVRGMEADTAWRTAELRVRHYHRDRMPLSLADCVLLASAGDGDAVATADGPLARAAAAEGIRVTALPDSRGRRPRV